MSWLARLKNQEAPQVHATKPTKLRREDGMAGFAGFVASVPEAAEKFRTASADSANDALLEVAVTDLRATEPLKPQSQQPTKAELIELRRLIWVLLWDIAESEREGELGRSSLDVFTALECYRLCYREYERLGELKLNPNDSSTICWGVW